MKQVVRRVIDRRGKVITLELPEPHFGADQILVENHFSLISSGTEMSTLSKTPLELVKQTLSDPWMRHVVAQTIFAAGPLQTGRRVLQEMLIPREIGYSGAGRVLAVGENVEGLQVGNKVAYAATGHAESAAPTMNHVVAVSEAVDLRHAAFVTVGGIALQAIRRTELQLGETVVILGLGLVGQLTAMIAKAAGCVVIGVDLDPARNRLAESLGSDLTLQPGNDDIERQVMDFTGKRGADATIICASSKSAEVINTSMKLTRRQGRVVLVGYVKLDINPKNFLYKEIDLRYSRAYGPGSYHRAYEQGRVDYPFGYVRWTEQRNLAEVIRLIETGALKIDPLIDDTYPVEKAQEAFDAIAAGSMEGVAALLDYGASQRPAEKVDRRRAIPVRPRPKAEGNVGISLIGVGNHVLGTHLPALKRMKGVEVRALVSATGKNASMVAKSTGATAISTRIEDALDDDGTDGVLVCSSHPEHRDHLKLALEAGKAIYVEKPTVSRLKDLQEVIRLYVELPSPPLFTVGLNRRYSPMMDRLRGYLGGPATSVKYSVCHTFVPADHWTLDEVDGAGRLITEGEHFIDICNILIGKTPISVMATHLGDPPDDLRQLCNFSLTVYYPGAEANIVFHESGAKGFPRERVMALGSGRVGVLDDFSRLEFIDRSGKKKSGSKLNKEMGHQQGLAEFIKAIRGEENVLLNWQQAMSAAITMFAAQESIRTGALIDLRRFSESLTNWEAEGTAGHGGHG